MYQKSEFVLPDRQDHIGNIHETDKGRVSVYINTWFKKRGEKEDNVMVDFRRYYLNKDGNWLPTGKGFSVPYNKDIIASFGTVTNKLKASVGLATTDTAKPVQQQPQAQSKQGQLLKKRKSSLESAFVVDNDDLEDDIDALGLGLGSSDIDDLDDLEELDDDEEDIITKLDSIPAKRLKPQQIQQVTAKSTSNTLPQPARRMIKKPIRKTGFSRLKAED